MKLPRLPENGDQRLYNRSQIQGVEVTIDGKTYQAVDWSPGGFSIKENEQKYVVGSQIEGDIILSKYPGTGHFEAKIIRIDENGLVAAKFSQLSSTEYIDMCLMVS